MAKKIRFPLELADGTQARSWKDLKEHFDLESVLYHYKSGKLLRWLRDHNAGMEADSIEALDESASDFQKKLCEIFGVEFSGSDVSMEKIARRLRMVKLRQFTDANEYIQNIDAIAFNEKELTDLLKKGCAKIYLCGEEFIISTKETDKTYIGVNSPKVKVLEDWTTQGITFAGCEVETLSNSEWSKMITEEITKSFFQGISALKKVFAGQIKRPRSNG